MTSAAARMRHYRTRRREGSRIARTVVDNDVVAALVDTGMLSAIEADDPQCLGDTLADIVDCWIRGNLEIASLCNSQTSDALANHDKDTRQSGGS